MFSLHFQVNLYKGQSTSGTSWLSLLEFRGRPVLVSFWAGPGGG
ncbi:MAG: hypothetical protein AB1566_07540 [Chloroflexota bacterium]